MTGGARRALPTGGDESEDDVVTGGQPSNAGTDFLHHAGTFVPADDGQRTRQVASYQVLVGVAHARGSQLDQYLTLLWRVELDRLDAPALVPLPQNCCFGLHGVPPSRCRPVSS